MTSRITKVNDNYSHVRVINESGAVENWLLTDSDVERVRSRGSSKADLVPAFVAPTGIKAVLLRWAGVL